MPACSCTLLSSNIYIWSKTLMNGYVVHWWPWLCNVWLLCRSNIYSRVRRVHNYTPGRLSTPSDWKIKWGEDAEKSTYFQKCQRTQLMCDLFSILSVLSFPLALLWDLSQTHYHHWLQSSESTTWPLNNLFVMRPKFSPLRPSIWESFSPTVIGIRILRCSAVCGREVERVSRCA